MFKIIRDNKILLAVFFPFILFLGCASMNSLFINCGSHGVILQRGEKVIGYNSIQEAVDNAEKGDTITICSGQHFIDIEIKITGKSNLTITGKTGSQVVCTSPSEDVFNIWKSDAIIINGLHIFHETGGLCSAGCLMISDSKKVLIKDCDIEGSGFVGINIWGGKDITIENNSIHNCEFSAISIYPSFGKSPVNILVTGNRIYDNKEYSIYTYEGINLFDGSVIVNDWRSDNTFE